MCSVIDSQNRTDLEVEKVDKYDNYVILCIFPIMTIMYFKNY